MRPNEDRVRIATNKGREGKTEAMALEQFQFSIQEILNGFSERTLQLTVDTFTSATINNNRQNDKKR